MPPKPDPTKYKSTNPLSRKKEETPPANGSKSGQQTPSKVRASWEVNKPPILNKNQPTGSKNTTPGNSVNNKRTNRSPTLTESENPAKKVSKTYSNIVAEPKSENISGFKRNIVNESAKKAATSVPGSNRSNLPTVNSQTSLNNIPEDPDIAQFATTYLIRQQKAKLKSTFPIETKGGANASILIENSPPQLASNAISENIISITAPSDEDAASHHSNDDMSQHSAASTPKANLSLPLTCSNMKSKVLTLNITLLA